MKDTLSYQVQQLLKNNKIIVDFEELAFQIQSHPTYPSLHAVTGVLDHFNIENLALDVPKTTDTLNQFPKSFLAQVEIDSQKQFVIVTKSQNNCKLIFNAKEKKTITQSEFLDQFTGIMLAVERDKTILSLKSSNINPQLTKGLALLALTIFGLLLFSANSNIFSFSFLLLSILGVYTSLSIIKQEQGQNTVLGNAFCSNPTEKKNCNAVLSSKAASIYKHLKLSDLSLIYFSGLTLSTFLLIISNKSIFISELISIISLPIIIYSIFYQALVIKKWCFLCLGIVIVMCCQACLAITFFQPDYNAESILLVLLSFLCISAFWLSQSKFLKDVKTLEKIRIDYFKFKRNFELFDSQLKKSKEINTKIESSNEIVFGNLNSELNIIFITNPLCGHCKPVHKLIEQILKSYPRSTKLTIRFNINPKNPENLAVKITNRLLEIYHLDGSEVCLKAMHEIYGDSTSAEWFSKWEFCSEPQNYLSILKNEYSWCTANAINFTPEILINGRSHPRIYDRTDLIYFIEDLEEQSQISNTDPEVLAMKEA